MWNRSLRPLQRAQCGLDVNGPESGARRPNAEHGGEQTIVGMRGPRVRVRPRRFRILWRRCQAEAQHVAPGRELLDVAVRESRFAECLEEIEREVIRRACER